MWKSINLLWILALVGLVGCESNQVSMSDVEDAQKDVREQAEDTREVAQEARERIEAKKEELKEVTAEEHAKLAEEQAQLDKEKAEAAALTQEYRTQEAQDQYEKDQRARLNEAKIRIDTFDKRDDGLEGAALDAHNAHVNQMNELYNDADAQLDDLEAADADGWAIKHESFEKSMQRLNAELANLNATPASDLVIPEPAAVP